MGYFESKNLVNVLQYYDHNAGIGLQFLAVSKGKNKYLNNIVEIMVPSGMTSVFELAKTIAIDSNNNKKIDADEITDSFKNFSQLKTMNLQYGQHITLELDDKHLENLSDIDLGLRWNKFAPRKMLHNPPQKDMQGTITGKKGDRYINLAENNMSKIVQDEINYYKNLLEEDKKERDTKSENFNKKYSDIELISGESLQIYRPGEVYDVQETIDRKKESIKWLEKTIKNDKADLVKKKSEHDKLQENINNRGFIAKCWYNLINLFSLDSDRKTRNQLTKKIDSLKNNINSNKKRVVSVRKLETRLEKAKVESDDYEVVACRVAGGESLIEDFQDLIDQANIGDPTAKRKIRDIILNRMIISNAGETKEDVGNISKLSDDEVMAKFSDVFSKYNPGAVKSGDTVYSSPSNSGFTDLYLPKTTDPEIIHEDIDDDFEG